MQAGLWKSVTIEARREGLENPARLCRAAGVGPAGSRGVACPTKAGLASAVQDLNRKATCAWRLKRSRSSAHQEVRMTAEFACPDLEQLTRQRVCWTHLHGYWGSPTAQQNQLPASYPKL